jgi:hypothetical protein
MGKATASHDPNATIRDTSGAIAGRWNQGAHATTPAGGKTTPVRFVNAPKPPTPGPNVDMKDGDGDGPGGGKPTRTIAGEPMPGGC